MTYEESVKRIEEIVAKMESGKMPLDESIKYFQEGMKLLGECKDMLDKYEKAIKIATGEVNGELVEEDFIAEDRTAQND
ncbi:MAG: exodeoxyribonuclease VII small subunit [Clostridia bacterium]|jgi:exodeoxyribonuclease VII small subunit|nr:exodeoxyribonuclease VII small subunit [Clostridia bacterium]